MNDLNLYQIANKLIDQHILLEEEIKAFNEKLAIVRVRESQIDVISNEFINHVDTQVKVPYVFTRDGDTFIFMINEDGLGFTRAIDYGELCEGYSNDTVNNQSNEPKEGITKGTAEDTAPN